MNNKKIRAITISIWIWISIVVGVGAQTKVVNEDWGTQYVERLRFGWTTGTVVTELNPDNVTRIVFIADNGTTTSADLGDFTVENNVLTLSADKNMILRSYSAKGVVVESDTGLTIGENTDTTATLMITFDGGESDTQLWYSPSEGAIVLDTAEWWVYGGADIGDATSDRLSITARIDTDVDPSANGTKSLGGASLRWDLQGDDVTVDDLTVDTSIYPSSDGVGEIGSDALTFDDVNAGTATVATAVIGGELTIFNNSVPRINATNESFLFIESDGGVTIDIDDNGNSSEQFQVRNGSSTVVFSVDEAGAGDISGSLQVDGTLNVDGAATLDTGLTLGNGTDTQANMTITADGSTGDGTLAYDAANVQWEIGTYFIFKNAGDATIGDSSGTITMPGTLDLTSGGFRLASAPPASASASGTTGDISWDSNYVYVCVATNTWKRVAIATW